MRHWVDRTATKLFISKTTVLSCLLLLKGPSGVVVMGGDSRSEGREFESQCHILDGHFFTLICCKIGLMFI